VVETLDRVFGRQRSVLALRQLPPKKPPKKLPFPALIFDGQLKTRHAPGTSFEPYPIPVLADPKKIIQALDRLRDLKTFASADAVNTTTGPGVAQVHFRRFRLSGQTLETGLSAQRLRNNLLPQV